MTPAFFAVVGGAGGLPTLVLPHVAFGAILPEMILAGGAVVLMLASSMSYRRLPVAFDSGLTIATALASMGSAWWLWYQVRHHGAYVAISGALAVDGFSILFLVLISGAVLLTALLAGTWLEREEMAGPEMHALVMLSASGAMFMAAANDLIVVFLGLEIMSIALYVLAGYHTRRAESGESALKYFVLGAFSSAIFVYGIALVYGATGSTNIAHIASYLAGNVSISDGLLLAGLALLLVGFGFKVALVPFHTWTPDVYQGSPSPVTGFMAAVAKAAGFAGLVRVFYSAFETVQLDWKPAIWVLALVTLATGAVLAVVQTDVKRMLAYSSINHAGFVLLGLYALSARGNAGSLYYLLVYAAMVIGSFGVVTIVGGRGDAHHDIEAYRGLGRRQPALALAFAVLLVAQAGVPLTTGFLAKFYVLSAVVQERSWALATVAIVSAVLVGFFYLRVIVVMYAPAEAGLRPSWAERAASVGMAPVRVVPVGGGSPLLASLATGSSGGGPPASPPGAGPGPAPAGSPDDSATDQRVGWGAAVALAICVAVTVGFGVYPAPLVDFARQATLLF